MEEQRSPHPDPIQQVYDGLAEEAKREVLKKPHDRETWLYHKRPPLRFRASESGDCPRKIYYRLIGAVPRPDSPQLRFAQICGNVMQDVIRALFRKYGVSITGIDFDDTTGEQKETIEDISIFQVETPDGEVSVSVSARADGDFVGDTLFEHKTVKERSAYWSGKAFEKGGEEACIKYVAEKQPWHMTQVQTTMAVFNRTLTYFLPMNKNAPDWGYADKDGHHGLYIALDTEMVGETLAKFAGVKKAVKAGEPPSFKTKGVPMDGSFTCTNLCPFYNQCYGKLREGKVLPPEGLE